jgi:hypothetical protein
MVAGLISLFSPAVADGRTHVELRLQRQGGGPRRIGESRGVGYILRQCARRSAPSDHRAADQVSDGFQLWSERFDRELTDVFRFRTRSRLQSQVPCVTLGIHETKRLPGNTDNVEAYDRY